MPIRINELDPVTTINGGEFIPVVQDGDTKKAMVSDTLGYKVYRADISYNGSSMVVNVLNTSLFGITIYRSLFAGSFVVNSETDQFFADKTVLYINQNDNNGNPPVDAFIFNSFKRSNDRLLGIKTIAVDVFTSTIDQDDYLTHLSIEIRVYP